MAKFDEIYPYHPTHITQEAVTFEGSELIKYGEPGICWHCGDETGWIDTIFAAHLCSEECERAKWREYAEAYNGEQFL